jgi:hypothetical protein
LGQKIWNASRFRLAGIAGLLYLIIPSWRKSLKDSYDQGARSGESAVLAKTADAVGVLLLVGVASGLCISEVIAVRSLPREHFPCSFAASGDGIKLQLASVSPGWFGLRKSGGETS